MRSLLGFPFPVAAAVAAFQLPPELMEGAPGWLVVFLMGVAVTAYIAEKLGKLPGGNGDRRKASFSEDDRAALRKVTDLLAHRGDGDDGVERFLLMNQRIRAQDDRLDKLDDRLKRLVTHAERQSRSLETIAAHIQRSA